MAGNTFIGTAADEDISPSGVSPTVTSTGPAPFPTGDTDIIIAGGGKDNVASGDGADGVHLGAGNDTYAWGGVQGGGSDIVDGGAGTDRAVFKGYGGRMALAASDDGHALVASLDSSEVVDLVRVESLLLEGADASDTFLIGDLSATHVKTLTIDLSTAFGSGAIPDAFEDSVGMAGTTRSDRINISSTTTTVKVTGLSTTLTVRFLDPLVDELAVIGDRGNDQINASKVLASQGGITLAGGAGRDTLIGSPGDNFLSGDDGADLLDGGKGSDNLFGGTFLLADLSRDRLKGGGGQDLFWIALPNTSANADAILDFKPGIDTIVLFDSEVIDALGMSVDFDEFHIGKGAADPNDHLVYNARTGALFFDANGSEDGMAIKIATLSRGLPLTANDFFVLLP